MGEQARASAEAMLEDALETMKGYEIELEKAKQDRAAHKSQLVSLEATIAQQRQEKNEADYSLMQANALTSRLNESLESLRLENASQDAAMDQLRRDLAAAAIEKPLSTDGHHPVSKKLDTDLVKEFARKDDVILSLQKQLAAVGAIVKDENLQVGEKVSQLGAIALSYEASSPKPTQNNNRTLDSYKEMEDEVQSLRHSLTTMEDTLEDMLEQLSEREVQLRRVNNQLVTSVQDLELAKAEARASKSQLQESEKVEFRLKKEIAECKHKLITELAVKESLQAQVQKLQGDVRSMAGESGNEAARLMVLVSEKDRELDLLRNEYEAQGDADELLAEKLLEQLQDKDKQVF